ncbi:MAG: class I SAM-dependent methyltransferase [Candidatus Uhrbacteria bacterium]|nr:class I SAM-dependent methyltransferase [Candidatus Uhrbacteria bacterium]
MKKNLAALTVQCPKCPAGWQQEKGMICEHGALERNDTIFFTEESATMGIPVIRPDIFDPHLWSSLRQAEWIYYQSRLQNIDRRSIVLDVGAGDGVFRSLFKDFENYVTVDFLPFPGIDLVADLTKRWPIRDQSIDVLIASNSFEHLPNTVHVLEECFRVLKPGGRLMVVIPFLLAVHQKPHDYVRHTFLLWERLLSEMGFDATEISPLGSVYSVHQTTRNKMFQYLYTVEPFKRSWQNKLWQSCAKLLHRVIKAIEATMFPVFFRFAPSDPDFTEGYAFTARKKSF